MMLRNLPLFTYEISDKTYCPKSPLRYPGGKARAVSILLKLIPKDTKFMVSPFLGGGSLEIAAASLGIKVFAFDVFKPLVVFWKHLLSTPFELAEEVNKFFPLSKEKFYDLQKESGDESIISAAKFYVLNRSSFSGATYSGGMSPNHPRFTLSSINYLRNFRCSNMKVDCLDFVTTFNNYKTELMYIDPPYMIGSTLYGHKGNTHKDFDHLKLAELLQNRFQWILSYNNSREIREIYKDFQIIEPTWKYGMSNNKNSRELIILSKDINTDYWSLHGKSNR